MASLLDQQQQSYLGDLSGALGIYGGLSEGGAKGDVAAGASAAKIGSNTGLFGSATNTVNAGATSALDILGIYGGLEQGGTAGDIRAGASGAQLLGTGLKYGASEGIFGSADGSVSEIGGVASTVGGAALAGLSLYNFVENWSSGKTGSDALSGAEAGAAVGSVVPGIGTAVGAIVGGIVGAVSSVFGPGAIDPEQATWTNYFSAYKQGGASELANITPQQSFQTLAGVFDERSSDTPMYAQFGRAGEGAFMTSMADQINTAVKAGKIPAGASAQTIFNKVVNPWISSMDNPSGTNGKGWAADGGYQGDVPALKNLVTTLIGQYTSGQITSKTAIGISGQADTTLPAYAGAATAASSKVAATAAATKAIAPLHTAVASMPGLMSSSDHATAMLGLGLAMPGVAALGGATGAKVANPTNPGELSPTQQANDQSYGSGVSDPYMSELQGVDSASSSTGSATSASTGSSVLSDLGSFLSSPLGNVAEFGTLAGLGLSEANSQKSENDSLAGSLSATGAPYTAAGSAELAQLSGGPSVGGAEGAAITSQQQTAAQLSAQANTYSTGQLTSAQNSQVQSYIAQQKAQLNTQLAASGNIDSSAQQAGYQQIDNNAAQLTQQLINGNLTMAEAAQTSVGQTYSTLLNQALSSSEFGFSTQEAAVQTQIQSDTALAGQLQQLFAGIAEGFGSSLSGKSGGSGVGGALGSALGGVASGASGGGATGTSQIQSEQNETYSNLDLSTDNQAAYEGLDLDTGIESDIAGQNIDDSAQQALTSGTPQISFPDYADDISLTDPFG